MRERKFDVMGLLDGGKIAGYFNIAGEGDGICGDHILRIEPTEIVASTTPLIDFLPLMKNRAHLFVLDGARLSGIVTAADLQKSPVRMLLFGLVSLLEMQMLALIRRNFSGDTFKDSLNPTRLEAAASLHRERINRNEEIDLADCLQFCDKRVLILAKVDPVGLGFSSKSMAKKFFKDAESLRNRLAHSQDLILGCSWAEVIDLAVGLDAYLQWAESDPINSGS